MDEKGLLTIDDFRGASLPKLTEWKHLDLNYKIVARINRETCIGCDLCYTACWDGAHQCIHIEGAGTPEQLLAQSRARLAQTSAVVAVETAHTPAVRIPKVDEQECVGCNLCWLVCPVENCITMDRVDTGLTPQSWAQRGAG